MRSLCSVAPSSPGWERPRTPHQLGGLERKGLVPPTEIHPPFRSVTAEPDRRDPHVVPAGSPTPCANREGEPSSGASVPGSPERQTGGKSVLAGKRAFFTKQGRVAPGLLWPGARQWHCRRWHPGAALGAAQGMMGSAHVPRQLPGRGGEENPAPAMGFSGHH